MGINEYEFYFLAKLLKVVQKEEWVPQEWPLMRPWHPLLSIGKIVVLQLI